MEIRRAGDCGSAVVVVVGGGLFADTFKVIVLEHSHFAASGSLCSHIDQDDLVL